MRMRAGAKDLANGGRSRGRAAVRGRDEADGWGIPVSVPRRGERGGSDERDPPVSDPQREEGAAHMARAWAEREWAGLQADFPATRCTVLFFFFFLCSF